MKILIVYDSVFGNTARLALVMRQTLSAEAVKVSAADESALKGADCLIMGSPTRAFRPTPAIRSFLERIPREDLRGVRVAAFDTRLSLKDIRSKLFDFMVKLFGYAADPILKGLVKKGGTAAGPAEGFFVKASGGPLKDGEEERAVLWARSCVKG